MTPTRLGGGLNKDAILDPEVTDYYVCGFVALCALNTAKNVAYPYARTVRCTDEVLEILKRRETDPI